MAAKHLPLSFPLDQFEHSESTAESRVDTAVLVRLTKAGKVLWLSNDLFGNRPELLVGLPFAELFPPGCQRQVRRVFKPETARTTQRLSVRDPVSQRSAAVLVRPSESADADVAFFAVVMEHPKHSQPRRPEPSDVEGQVTPGCNRVLVAEDEPVLRSLIGRILNMGGYQVVLTDNGDDFVTQLEESEEELALILLDLEMPGPPLDQILKGFDQHRRDVPLVIVTGHSFEDVKAQLADRDYSHLRKPFSNGDLLKLASKLAPLPDD